MSDTRWYDLHVRIGVEDGIDYGKVTNEALGEALRQMLGVESLLIVSPSLTAADGQLPRAAWAPPMDVQAVQRFDSDGLGPTERVEGGA